jgi:hypothetical protein
MIRQGGELICKELSQSNVFKLNRLGVAGGYNSCDEGSTMRQATNMTRWPAAGLVDTEISSFMLP